MENDLGTTIKTSVFFKVKLVAKKFSICNKKIHERILKSYVKIKFEILSVAKHFEAQYLEFNFDITLEHFVMSFFVNNTELFYYKFQFKNYKNF